MTQVSLRRTPKSWGKRLLDNIRMHPWLYIMILPAIAYFVVFHYAPMYGVIIAFQDYKPIKGIWGSPWVGLKHFQTFVEGPFFWRLIRNTLSINIGMLLFGFPLPIIFALLLNEVRSTAFRKVVQTVTYMPHFVSSVVVCGLMVIFCRSDGLLTSILSVFGMPQTNLLTVEQYFQPLYIGMNIWQELGWDSIIYFAAITGIDPQLYEAADIDGANRWKKIAYITFPSIKNAISINLIFSLSDIMLAGFDQIYNMVNPAVYGKGDVLETYLFRIGISGGRYDQATAVGLFNSLVGFVLVIAANKFSKLLGADGIW